MKKQTLDDIYRSYMGDIHNYLFSLCHDNYLAEDIMQETFYRAYLYLEDCPGDKIKPWLLRVAYNAFIDYLRKNSKSSLKEEGFFHNLAGAKSPEDEMIMKEQLEEIDNLIERLPENQKQAIFLCDFQELSYREAAQEMKINEGHLKILLFRARQKIRLNRKGIDNNE